MPMRGPTRLFIAFCLVVAARPALAQAPQGTPTRIRGTVVKLVDHTLLVRSRNGEQLALALAPNFTVSGVVKEDLADVRNGDFVAATSIRGADGRQRAVEVHVLPGRLRGVVREGQFPWDLVPHSLMTNATAAGITAAPQGRVLHVTWKGGSADLLVPPGTPIVAFVPGDASLLKPGAAIFAIALKKPDGTLSAARVTAEKNGVKPPL
jgi:hypothetical protein